MEVKLFERDQITNLKMMKKTQKFWILPSHSLFPAMLTSEFVRK